MTMTPSKSSHKTKVLFDNDGVSVLATFLPPFSDNIDESNASTDDIAAKASQFAVEAKGNDVMDGPEITEAAGIILTLFLQRQEEKNVVNPTMISLLGQALDVIENHPMVADINNKALIITGLSFDPETGKNVAKFFGNGLDLEWMLKAGNSTQSSPVSTAIQNFNTILARILTLPFRTVAAINGHAIGAGLFLALACDYRIMRTERGYLSWPEARLGMRLTKGFAELSKAKIGNGRNGNGKTDHHVLREGLFTAKKYTPSEALSSGIIDGEYPIDELYTRAFQLAMEGLPESPLGLNLDYFDPKGYREMKMEMYTDAYRALMFGSVEDLPYSRI